MPDLALPPAAATAPVGPAAMPSAGPASGSPALLPEAPAFDVGDALAEMMKLSSALSEVQTKSAMNRAESVANGRKAATDARMAAINEAIEAARKAAEEKEDGGLFDCITDNLGPVGLVAMAVGSVYIAAADVAAHAVGLEDEKLDLADAAGLGAMMAGGIGVAVYATELCIKKYGPEELQKALDSAPTVHDDDVRTANKVALAITQAQLALSATVASGGATVPMAIAMVGIGISTATQVMQDTGAMKAVFGEDAKWVALGGSLTGAALGLGAGVACSLTGKASEAKTIVANVDRAKSALQAGHDIHQGVRNLRAADYAHESDLANVEAKQHRESLERIERMIDAVIDDMRSIKESAQKSSEILQATMQTRDQTLLLAGNMKA